MSHLFKGLSLSNQRHRLSLVTAAAGVAGVGLAAHALSTRNSHARPRAAAHGQKRFLMPQIMVDAIAGAVGEVSQIVLLYPLETIKVRCQADGISALEVVRIMTRNGVGPQFVSQLYAGIGSATAFSVVVGAIHWLTFCAAKRTSLDHMQKQEAKKQQQQRAGSTAAAAAADVDHQHHPAPGDDHYMGHGAVASTVSTHPHAAHGTHAHIHVSSGHHVHEEDVALKRAGGTADAGAPCVGGAEDEADLRMVAAANMVGATVGAVMTALVEGPLELFRHQAQAGIISGNLFKEMSNVVRKQGPLGLYWGFLPYCMESFPYDISELSTYSQLRDVYNGITAKADPKLMAVVNSVPSQVWDVSIGACAGSAATLISMPFDVVKTYMQTHATEAINKNALGQVIAFFQTGVRMVATRGPGALWVGVVPRLAQQVPSCTICWWAVEATQLALKPWTAPA